MRSRADKSECSESEAFVGTRGRRADGETFDSEREGGFRGRLQGGASGGKPQVSHNRPLACPARRAQGVNAEGIEPGGKTQNYPPHFYRRRALPASLFLAGTTGIFPFSPLLSMTFPLCPPGGGKGPVMGALPPFEAPFQTPESPPLPRAEALCSLLACSNESFAFGTGGRIHPSPYGGRHEVRTRGLPFVRTPARCRRYCQGAGMT